MDQYLNVENNMSWKSSEDLSASTEPDKKRKRKTTLPAHVTNNVSASARNTDSSTSTCKERPQTLSVDKPNHNDRSSSPRFGSGTRHTSGESSDEKEKPKMKCLTPESSFERSVSFQENTPESKKSDLTPISDSCSKSFDSSRSGDPVMKEKDKKGEKKSKKAWYNILNPTYKSRSEDLKRLFKDLPGDERLIVDYSCALQKDILVHGRLYVTQNYFCFYSKIFGWETYECIKCKDISSITKEKTALVIPNALLINAKGDKHFFTSFTARDKTYMILFRNWQNALLGQQMGPAELWQCVHSCYGEELGLTSDDDDYVAPSTEDDSKTAFGGATFADRAALKANPSADNYGVKSDEIVNHYDGSPRKSPKSRDTPSFDTPLELHTDSSNTFETEDEQEKHLVADISCPNLMSHHCGREVNNVVYGIPIDTLFTLLFTNSKFMLDLHTARKTTDVVCSEWQADEETNNKIRQVTYTVTLPTNSLGPKVSHVTETQVLSPHSVPGQIYSVDSEACNSGIPYADSFSVSTHWCLTRESKNETRLCVWSVVKYKKSVWGFMKGVIDKNSYSGVENMISDLHNSLMLEADKSSKSGRRRRRRKDDSRKIIDDNIIPNKIENSQKESKGYEKWITFGIFFILLIMNALLYHRLYNLETKLVPEHMIDSSLLKISKYSDDNHLKEWIYLLQQQEMLHTSEIRRWKEIVNNAADNLKKAEESLRNLHQSIPTHQASKIQMLLSQLQKMQQEKAQKLFAESNSVKKISNEAEL